MKRRLRAYTLMEVTIAMLLAGLVIGITYTVYFIVVRAYSSYAIKATESASLVLLDKLLSKDMEKAAIVEARDSGLVLRTTGSVVSYVILPDFIIRNGGITDTFKVRVQSVKYLFEHKDLMESHGPDEAVRLDELQLELLFRERTFISRYYKTYSSTDHLKKDSHAPN